jgi:riboflavin transporter FmnP
MAGIAGVAGSFVMGVVSVLTNYFILLPLFESFMPLDQLIAAFEAYIPFIHTKLDVVLYNTFPFNLLKGLVITAITMLIYKRISPILKGK